MTDLFHLTAGCLFAFLIGSLPFSFWVTRIFRGVDIRTVGSKNAGATNVFRTQGKALGSLALFLDAAKGVAAVTLLSVFFIPYGFLSPFLYKLILGVFAICGHVWTPFLKWKGGKGVATSAGVFLSLLPGPFFIAFLTFVGVFAVSRIISISSLSAATVFPFAVFFFNRNHPDFLYAFLCSILLAAFIFYTHRVNIARLLKGEENKLINKKN